MASLLAKIFDFAANAPVSSLDPLDDEFQQLIDVLNGTSTGTKFLMKSSDASDPPLEVDQTGAGPLAEWKANGVLKASIENDGDLLANGVTGAAGVYTFTSIPVGPASNPTTDNQLARKAYVDARKTAFSVSFGVADPSTPTVNDVIEGMVSYMCPDGNAVTLTKIRAKFERGSHTSGGSVTFAIQRRQAADNYANPVTLGEISLDDTNNTKFQIYLTDIADTPLVANDTLIVFISARSGTITERDVSIILVGTQTVF